MSSDEIRINTPHPMKKQTVAKKSGVGVQQTKKDYLSPLQKPIRTGKIQTEDTKEIQEHKKRLKMTEQKQVSPNIGSIWVRKIDGKAEKVIVTMYIPGKNPIVQFISKAAFDHGDMCNTWSLGIHHFLKTFQED